MDGKTKSPYVGARIARPWDFDLAISHAFEDIKEGRTYPADEALNEIRRELNLKHIDTEQLV
ncbi:MAG: hypothetical protein FWH20_00870 [Oscillospiraceae bacterium]|nr:hypothetical protein [Oscillospiraceae bacterium]